MPVKKQKALIKKPKPVVVLDNKEREADPLGNFRCKDCQTNRYPRYGNFSGIKAYTEGDGCHIFVKCKDVGHYGEVYTTTDGPPLHEGSLRTAKGPRDHGTRYYFETCKCICHTTPCGDSNWMLQRKWVKINNYDAED